MVLSQLLLRLEIPSTVHGLRSSFRDWAAECPGASWAVGESAIAHTAGNDVEAANMRSNLLEARRELLQEWADSLAG